jgi:hypothetical protein
MWILRIVRNLALLAMLALAAHVAAGSNKAGSREPECFGQPCNSTSCPPGCGCSASFGCVRHHFCDVLGDCLPKH